MTLNWKQRHLAQAMSDISEDAWSAGWMAGLEYDLWEMIINPTRQFVTAAVPIEKLEELAEIANDIGGWIVWDDEFGETFIPMDEWLKRYERFKTYGPTPEEL